MVNCFYDDEGAKKGSLSSDDNWSVRAPLSVPIPEEIPQPVPLPPSVSSQLPLVRLLCVFGDTDSIL